MAAVRGLLVCVAFHLVGELAARHLHLPLPGPVVGMLLLFAAFCAAPRLASLAEAGAGLLLRHMSLLFVPATIGALGAAALLRAEGARMALALVLSTALALLAGGWSFALAAKRLR